MTLKVLHHQECEGWCVVAPVHAVTLYDGDHCVRVMHITVLVSALECERLEMQAPFLPVVGPCACT